MNLRSVWTIAAKDLKLRFRDRSAYIQAFIAPFALAAIISLAFGSTESNFHPTFAVVNEDGGPVAQGFIDALKGPGLERFLDVKSAGSSKAARELIVEGEASAAFLLPAGFSASIMSGKPAEVVVMRNPTQAFSGEMANSIARSFATQIDAGRLAVAAALPEGSASPALVQDLIQRSSQLRLPVDVVEGKIGTREVKPAAYFGPSMAIFFLFFTVQVGASSFLLERAQGTLARLTASPNSTSTIVAGKVVSVVVMGLLSLGTLMVATSVVFGANLGDPLAVGAVCVAMVFAAVGITALVATLSRSQQQADSMGSMLIMALTLLGGNFIPINAAPELMRKLALLTPNGWALRSLSNLASLGGGIGSVLPALGAILGFALLTGGVAIFRARRMVVA